jgi:hypothetical protein
MAKGKFSEQQNQKKPVPNVEKGGPKQIEYIKPPKGKTKAIAVVPELIKPIANLDEIVDAFKKYQELKARLQAEGDIIKIRGKECSTRTFDDKLSKFFGISVDIIRTVREENKSTGEIVWYVWAKAVAPNGQFKVAGGACSSKERNFAHIPHDIIATAETRAKKRAIEELVGFGETLPIEDMEEKPEPEPPKKDLGEIPIIEDLEEK